MLFSLLLFEGRFFWMETFGKSFPQAPFKTFYLGWLNFVCADLVRSAFGTAGMFIPECFCTAASRFLTLQYLRASHWFGLNSGAVKHLFWFFRYAEQTGVRLCMHVILLISYFLSLTYSSTMARMSL